MGASGLREKHRHTNRICPNFFKQQIKVFTIDANNGNFPIVNGYVRIGCNFMALDETVSYHAGVTHAQPTQSTWLFSISTTISRQHIMDDVTENIR